MFILDTMELVGGSDLVGEYYFGYSYARRDDDNNILHESGAARAGRADSLFRAG